MRRAVICYLLIALVATVWSSTADADRKPRGKTRIARAGYTLPSIGVPGGPLVYTCDISPTVECARFKVGANERFASFLVEDKAGANVTAEIRVDGYRARVFCSETATPLPVSPGEAILISVFNGSAADELCPGIATSGRVIATFSNMP